jgi:hypothetical protein
MEFIPSRLTTHQLLFPAITLYINEGGWCSDWCLVNYTRLNNTHSPWTRPCLFLFQLSCRRPLSPCMFSMFHVSAMLLDSHVFYVTGVSWYFKLSIVMLDSLNFLVSTVSREVLSFKTESSYRLLTLLLEALFLGRTVVSISLLVLHGEPEIFHVNERKTFVSHLFST